MKITIVSKNVSIDDVRHLFLKYHQELNIDLSFQDFQDELTSLPGKYGPPDGCLCVAYDQGVAIGCVALRKFSDAIGEIKRLYVNPSYRKQHIALNLMNKIIACSYTLGYQTLLLDTLSSMTPAINLYKKIGFYKIDAYYNNPLKNVVYLRKDLASNQK